MVNKGEEIEDKLGGDWPPLSLQVEKLKTRLYVVARTTGCSMEVTRTTHAAHYFLFRWRCHALLPLEKIQRRRVERILQ